MFTALRKFLEPTSMRRLIREMGLNDRDEYLAIKASGLLTHQGLDWEKAYEVLGEDNVNEWVAMGTFADSSDPIAFENLDHWCDPDSRKTYYEEHLAKHTTLRRTGSMCVKVHPNFTIAEIEHAMRNK